MVVKSNWVAGKVLAKQARLRGDTPFMQFEDGPMHSYAEAHQLCNRTGNGYADAKRQAGSGLRIGQSVFHNKFGEGVIAGLEGEGDAARANIKFKRHGAKWLVLSVAKLDPID